MSQVFIQFSHLFKSFCLFPLFEGISFSINDGDLFALIGENGAGKTTFLHLPAGRVQPDCGELKKKAITFSRRTQSPSKDRNIMAYDKKGDRHQKSLQQKLETLKRQLEELEASANEIGSLSPAQMVVARPHFLK